MIELQYTTSAQENAKATLDFMSNRPVVAFSFKFMRVTCLLLCCIFAITWYNKSLRPQDYTAVLFAIVWFFYYKNINRWVIGRMLKLRKFNDMQCLYKIDDKSILYKLQNFQPQNIEWKKLKHVLRNNEGYIIPLTGFVNAGRFLWLPLRSLQNQEPEFLELINKFKLKLRRV